MKRIGVGGSSANPPQIGHLQLIQGLVDCGFLDKVVWIPCGSRTDKKNLVDGVHRWEMTQLMIGKVKLRKGAELQVRREDVDGVNRLTLEWMEKIQEENPGDEIWWYSGSDVVAPGSDGLGEVERSWYLGRKLMEKWPLLVVPRIGYEIPDIDNEYWKRFKAVEIIPLQVMEVSSSEVRQRLSKGSGMDEMTLKEIADYIYKNKLYDSKL